MTDIAKDILGSVTIAPETAEEVKKSVRNIADFSKTITGYLGGNTTNLLDTILFGAIVLQASDIHIEPQEAQVRLRARIDGVLQDVLMLEQEIYQALLSRLKLLSKIKLNIVDNPQDGRFSILVGDKEIEVRTSSLPAEYGETVVMRILNPENLKSLDNLGLRQDLHELFTKEIKRPNGMIVVTGPTGAGKTTTLYAFLMQIQNPEIKIVTIEDPIEYHIKGVSQTQAAPEKGYSFADGLRSIVRQDPDVILVGEIRDLETTKIALQASLTGHLVLTTLHTNDAAGTIPRLIDLGGDQSSISSALKMVVAQRLVRKVCAKCSSLIKPSAAELAEIKKGLKGIPKNILDEVKTRALNSLSARPSTKFEFGARVAKVKEGGCKDCNFTGYKDRTGLYEVFLVDAEMEKMILKNPPVSDVKELAIKKGMVTIWQSGLLEVIEGQTTLEEVKKVVGEDE